MEFSSQTGEENEGSKSLETLLLEKNKSLQAENTKLKNSNSDLTGESWFPSLVFHPSRQRLCVSVCVSPRVCLTEPVFVSVFLSQGFLISDNLARFMHASSLKAAADHASVNTGDEKTYLVFFC